MLQIYLLYKYREPEKTPYEYFLYPFTPFSPDAWLLIAVAMIYMAWAIRFIKAYTKNSLKMDDEKKNLFTLRSIGHAFYDGINSMTTGGVAHVSEQPSIPEKLVVSGFAVFALVVLTAYTATSAAVMIDDQGETYNNLQEVIDKGKNICLREAIAETFLSLYPQFSRFDDDTGGKNKIRAFTSNEEMFSYVDEDSNACIGVIIDIDGLAKLQADYYTYCEYARVGEVLMSVMNSIPVSPSNYGMYADISYIIQKGASEGLYTKKSESAKKRYLGESKCSIDEGSHSQEGEDPSIGAIELFGPLFITFTMTTVGLLLYLWGIPKEEEKHLGHSNGTLNDLALKEEVVEPKMNMNNYQKREQPIVDMKSFDHMRGFVHKQGTAGEKRDISARSSALDENDTLADDYYQSILRRRLRN